MSKNYKKTIHKKMIMINNISTNYLTTVKIAISLTIRESLNLNKKAKKNNKNSKLMHIYLFLFVCDII